MWISCKAGSGNRVSCACQDALPAYACGCMRPMLLHSLAIFGYKVCKAVCTSAGIWSWEASKRLSTTKRPVRLFSSDQLDHPSVLRQSLLLARQRTGWGVATQKVQEWMRAAVGWDWNRFKPAGLFCTKQGGAAFARQT